MANYLDKLKATDEAKALRGRAVPVPAAAKAAAAGAGAAGAEEGLLRTLLGFGKKAPLSVKALGVTGLLAILSPIAKAMAKDVGESRKWRGLAGDLDEAKRYFRADISDEEIENIRMERNMADIRRMAMMAPDELDSIQALMVNSEFPRLTTSQVRMGGIDSMDRGELNKALARSTLMDRVRASSGG